MRVLLVGASYLPDSVGGVELHMQGLARALQAAGHEVAVLCRAGAPDQPHLSLRRDQHEDVPVFRLANTFEDATTLERLYAHPGIADACLEVVDQWRPDLVHVHHLTCLSTALLDRLAERGLPTLMTLHDFWMGCPRGQRITADLRTCPEIRLERCVPCLRELWPHLLGEARAPGAPAEEQDAGDRALLEQYHADIQRRLTGVDQLVTPSAFMARLFEAQGLPPGSVRVVENGLPTDRYPPPVERGGRAGPVRIGFIGSVLPSKGVHLLMEAFRRLGDPGRARLDVFGEVLPFHNDRSYGARLEALRAGFEASVTLHGRYDNADLPAILADLDVVVVPSLWYEAFCLTIREAFLAGVPVITADHGAMAEAVEDGVSGLLFEPGDVDSLTEALRRLVGDPVLRARLGRCRERVRDEADTAAELLGLYQDLLAGRPS